MTPDVKRLIDAAKRVGGLSRRDSLEDQKDDPKLQTEAIEARERLPTAIDRLY